MYERFENVGTVLGRHPGRRYTGGQRSPTLVDALPPEHPFSRLIQHAGIRWAYVTPPHPFESKSRVSVFTIMNMEPIKG